MHRFAKPFLGALTLALLVAIAGCAEDDDPLDPAAPEPSPTSEAVPTTTAAPVRDFSAIHPIVEEFVEANDLNGAGLIVVDAVDGVIHEDYWGDFSADRVSLIASASKMITAGVLLHLDDEGLLDIDAPVADVVEWGTANPAITPAQLLSNSSGLPGLIESIYPAYLCQFASVGTLQACAERIFTTSQDDDDVIAPDSRFRYGGVQWQIAGAVAEVASGQSWDALIDEIYNEPCGLESLAYNNHFLQLASARPLTYPAAFDGDPSVLREVDNPNMEGGVYTTPGDYARLLLMHLRGGMCGETQVLSEAALERAHTDRVAQTYEGAVADDNPGYGMGWWVDRETGRLTDAGAYGAVPWLDLDAGYGAYLVIEETSEVGLALADELYGPVEAAVAG